MAGITDPDVRTLALVSATLEADYAPPSEDPWSGSPFAWIRSRPSRQRGAIGEKLVAGWCEARGFDVMRSPNSEADRVINGHLVEIKFSTQWESGVYKFQQIRDQNYDQLFCLGLSPFAARAWVIPKTILLTHVIGKMGQHTGASGQDTAWLSFPVGSAHEWMAPYGGALSDAWKVFEQLGRGAY